MVRARAQAEFLEEVSDVGVGEEGEDKGLLVDWRVDYVECEVARWCFEGGWGEESGIDGSVGGV